MADCIRIENVVTDSFSMDYFKFGHGEETLVILPGLSVRSVTEYADAIAGAYRLMTDDFTVYVFDRRREVPDTYTVSDMARDTAEALVALGLERVDLFGASQGGMIAMTMAMEYPALVSKLILCSTTACMAGEEFGTVEKWIELAKAGNAADLYLSFGEAIYPRRVFELMRSVLTEEAKNVTDEDLARFVILAQGMRGFDATDGLSKIACPALVIGSRDDALLGGGAAEKIAHRLGAHTEVTLYIYDGYGHAAYDTAPDIKERMMRFLKGQKKI